MSGFFAADDRWFGLLLPFVVALAVGGLLRLVGGSGRGGAMAGMAVPAGFLAAWLHQRGLPQWPPAGVLSQVPYVALAGWLIGTFTDIAQVRRGLLLLLFALFAVTAAWVELGMPWYWSWMVALRAAILLAAWLAVLVRLESRAVREQTASVMLLMAALGVAGVAWFSNEPGFMRLGLALTAATGGFLVWNWILGAPFLATATLAGGGALMALAAAMAIPGRASPWALLVLLLIFFADGTAARMPSGSGMIRRVLAPLMLALVCLLPILLALATAYVAAHMP